MFLRTENLAPKKMVGKKLVMRFSNNRTAELWSSFMPQRKWIQNALGTDLYSMQIFPSPPTFQEDVEFVKWAAVEVSSFEDVPAEMETYNLRGGLYAVFLHMGTASAFRKTFEYIFQQWMPASGYELDDREHFELLGEKYKNNQEDSEEEIWIPIRPKIH